MPSVPQSLLWISLVVLWLFVLVPMLISKRDAVRRTSDVALATRVLNSDTAARLLKRAGPAAGHRSDPDWQPDQDELDDLEPDDTATAPMAAESGEEQPSPVAEDETPPHDDAHEEKVHAETAEQSVAATDDRADEDHYEYVDDTSGIPVSEEPTTTITPVASRRHRYDSYTAAAITARKYAFRKRVLMIMALTLVGSAAAAFLLSPAAWWICGSATGLTTLYLGYLRRQTRIEERLRRRRMQRMARSRLGVENAYDRELDVVPARLRRPGAVVLEIDDEDPVFEHLDYASYAAEYGWHRDLPRAVGQ